ncbi:MAG: hypothetical protein A3B99_00675 [Candidatus Yanofskybacteria bacterium RIFCSPHIGHO2_02_FULL_44_12b]|uniref:Uncharacterized protein n=2 Tax=Candidatus Yanofskyibacteriota TaxID=1752733 RepID=A0A1F8GJD2_9BACT|nr:MAG: hypothetical protein UW79_C0016G0002 [Candidatus Yanofskybacteria bacterium GW2011_GWA2_44_9]OGN05357.1 MAG: hypothetical protein A2659_02025 [Candidatus Yanofskybacteria bacterium RIFCSPHIGHO2_01_FULL_44_24]OGN15993.1 MAG: hypothetical protein A3B99_00675 [Candidatus Yanofskybacteria bacterium RIFCSPHIGHO2_02_FULL_44_12b]OGN25504.1 MAG: hypothetical protein A2925_02120 [Candidatus Yanofskybacteria bacterium RIFCSPLOWO2_01_FULL_44_22]
MPYDTNTSFKGRPIRIQAHALKRFRERAKGLKRPKGLSKQAFWLNMLQSSLWRSDGESIDSPSRYQLLDPCLNLRFIIKVSRAEALVVTVLRSEWDWH